MGGVKTKQLTWKANLQYSILLYTMAWGWGGKGTNLGVATLAHFTTQSPHCTTGRLEKVYSIIFLCYHMIYAPVNELLITWPPLSPHDCHSPELLSLFLCLSSSTDILFASIPTPWPTLCFSLVSHHTFYHSLYSFFPLLGILSTSFPTLWHTLYFSIQNTPTLWHSLYFLVQLSLSWALKSLGDSHRVTNHIFVIVCLLSNKQCLYKPHIEDNNSSFCVSILKTSVSPKVLLTALTSLSPLYLITFTFHPPFATIINSQNPPSVTYSSISYTMSPQQYNKEWSMHHKYSSGFWAVERDEVEWLLHSKGEIAMYVYAGQWLYHTDKSYA